MPLTDLETRQARPRDKDYKLSDAKGLYLLVKTSGAKFWRLKYRFLGKEKLFSIGPYPKVKLSEAREAVDEARRNLKNGVDPGGLKKLKNAVGARSNNHSFRSIGTEWFAKKSPAWSEVHKRKTWWMLEKNLFPRLGSRPADDIFAEELLGVLEAIEARGAFDTAKRARQVAGQVFRYAIITKRARHDPSRDLIDALTKVKKTHLAAITDPKAVGPLLRAIDGYHGTPVVRAALQLAPLTFVRPGELSRYCCVCCGYGRGPE